MLHVVESYGAGTATALHQYVRATPDLEHHLLRRLRAEDDHADDGELAWFRTVEDLPAGVWGAIRAVRRHVRVIRPDVVHAHSSLGGAFTRLALRRGRSRLVYTPHCFASERLDLSPLARRGVGLIERALARNTDVFAGCSPHELDITRRWARRPRRIWVPNVTDVTDVSTRDPVTDEGFVATLGRITAQRDPDFFIDFVTALRTSVPGLPARWIGGGDAEAIARLEATDIQVTGWLPHSEALAILGGARLYVHTARWDGAPMSLIEATALGVPSLAVSTAALTGQATSWQADTATALAGKAATAWPDQEIRQRILDDWRSAYAGNTREAQAAALRTAYGLDHGGRP